MGARLIEKLSVVLEFVGKEDEARNLRSLIEIHDVSTENEAGPSSAQRTVLTERMEVEGVKNVFHFFLCRA